MQPTRIFISYRRDDSALLVGRIAQTLRVHFGSKSVFLDIDDIPIGADFSHHLLRRMDKCNTTIVLIGPRWQGQRPDGTSRIFNESDHVRIEARTALGLPGHRVIPILIGNTPLPSKEELPPDVAPILDLNVYRVDPVRLYEENMARIVRQLTGAWWRSRMRQRQLFTALLILAPVLTYFVGNALYNSHLAEQRRQAQRSAIEAINGPLENYAFGLRDLEVVMDGSSPRAYVLATDEQDRADSVRRAEYNLSIRVLDSLIHIMKVKVNEGWGSTDSLLLGNWHTGLRKAVHNPIFKHYSPMVMRAAWELKVQLRAANAAGGWERGDSLAWDAELAKLEFAYQTIMPGWRTNVDHYLGQIEALRARFKVE